jgi:sugar O-acyltransferase (sialic acid O-acetyltransferase NeuD family)
LTTIIFGTGSHAIEVAELLGLSKIPNPIFLDEEDESILLENLLQFPCFLYIGVGYPEVRLKIMQRWNEVRDQFVTIKHPNSYVSPSASIGKGTVLQFGAVLSSHAKLGDGTLINWNATVGHHSTIGSGSVVNPGASVSGNCTLGDGVLIGTGARVLEGIAIGDHAVIGAGAVVTRNVPSYARYAGVPARVMK